MANDELEWQTLASAPGPELPLFKVRFDTLRHPTSDQSFERMVLETPSWVNVVAVTPDKKLVMVEQYRFGIGALTIEPTGGMVDPGEEHLQAAQRELLEETGFGEGDWQYLGSVQANPAMHDNVCHMWLARDVVEVQSPQPDPGEAIRVHVMSVDEVRQAFNDGTLAHPLGLAALSRVVQLWDMPDIGI